MNKQEFLDKLAYKIAALPQSEVEKSLAYFSEIIDDRVEDGMSEEEAVASLEGIDEIARKIMYDTPLPVLVKSRVKPKHGWNALNIVLLVLGFPLWFPLLVVFAAVVLAVFAVIWALILALFAVVAALAVAGVAGVVAMPVLAWEWLPASLLLCGCGLICVGVGVLAYFPICWLAKQLFALTKWVGRKVKSLFIRKEVA